jgi:uncharacterized protein
MIKPLGLLLSLILSLGLGVSLALAQSGYPQPTNTHVNDLAHLLTPADTTLIFQLLADLKTQNGIEATVVTLNSIHDYPTGDESIEAFATHLFNIWGIGDKASKGVLILVAAQDRKVRIELGAGYESQYNDEMQQVINEQMLPAFKQGDYSRGLYQGTRAVIGTLTDVWPPDERPVQSRSGNSNMPVMEVSSRSQSDSRMGIFLFGAFVMIVGYLILAHIFGWPVGNSRSGDDDDDHRPSGSSRSSSSHSSSASSKSSFGGGRSSGGGASGSW